MEVLRLRWQGLESSYEESMRNGDPRVENWLLMQTPWASLSLCIGYIIMCYVGPALMANRKPFDLKPLLILYNFAMVALSLYMAVEIFICARALSYNFICDQVVYSTKEYELRLAAVLWWFYFSKIIEFMDTAFFILRKKNNQITFLHVYHHSTMVFLWWIGVKWYAGGSPFFSAMINSSVHVVMYSYYLLAACGPIFRPFLWWKKYITMIQLVQFVVVLAHISHSLYIDCPIDKRPQWALVFYAISHILLFSNFYSHAYSKPRRSGDDGPRSEGGIVNGTPAVSNGSAMSGSKKDQ